MATKIFVNLPVKDLERSKEFYTGLGYTLNLQFTDDKAACVIISDEIYAMILKEEFFKSFIPNKQISDASKNTEVLLALSADTKDEVNQLVDKALAAGGKIAREPEDHGFMFTRSFEDPDGHTWEVFWMDMNAAPPQPQQ